MLSPAQKVKRNETGFTLVELLVVIIIIGILAAVAIPAFTNQRQRANDAAVLSDIRGLVHNINDALVACPNSDVIEITTDALQEISPIGNKQHLDYNDYKANSDAIIYAYVDPWVPGKGCRSGKIKLSDGTSLFIKFTYKSASSFSIYGWNSNGKSYTGTYTTEAEIMSGYQSGKVARYDFVTGKFMKYAG